jgi:3-phenylpropionate/trans-cinnamate dioxygenase ferredoxin reductase subunit
VLGATAGGAFAALHRAHGVDVRTSTGVEAITAGTAGSSASPGAEVRLSDGTVVEADLLVVGIGAVPGTALAENAGLEVEDGVLADERLTTTHPDVFVAGDIARAHHPTLGTSVRVEHWDNAKAQGATAARNMLGAGEAYDRLPYFFSDQYDLGMEYVGHVGPEGYDDVVVRGDLVTTGTAFWIRDGRVVAGMHTNDWDAATPMRAIVAAGAVDLGSLRDPATSLEDVVG